MRRACLSLLGLTLAAPALPANEVDYVREVKPVLAAKCYSCHGALRQKSKLRLDAVQLIRKGGRNGPAVTAGKADESLIVRAVLGKDHRRMPPEEDGEALKAAEIALLRKWIDQGARATDEPIPADPRDHWAYKPPVRAAVPPVGAGNAVDAFVAAARAKKGLSANPPADRAVLLRRVYLDLVGVPPTREELHAFLADRAPDAYEKVVDRLLASPLHGERWGRHWMDVWRYSDPFGNGDELRYSQRHVWRWRDWIVESLNADKGFDRMIVEMLAGDEVAPANRDTLRATGYLARNWYKFDRNAWMLDAVEYTAAGFLGVTMRCARCHDHKYDPIAQQDYYHFRAFFEPHDVRLDPVPWEKDVNKDGVARAFDGKADAPTYLFLRGDDRTPDKGRGPLAPAVPAVLGTGVKVSKVEFGPRELAAAVGPAAEEALRLARADLAAAEAGTGAAAKSVADAKDRLAKIAAGAKPAEQYLPLFLGDTFAKARPDVWTVVRGDWAWQGGKLVCSKPSTFATVTTKAQHPQALMGRVRYRTTGGGIGSVGFSYDVQGESFQAVYINAGASSAVRPFHRINGQDTYPQVGVVPHPVKIGQEVTLDFAVRGNLLNVWADGKLRSVYRLPVPRRAGAFSLFTHDATAEFLELRLAALPDSVVLAEAPGAERPSPLGGAVVLTKADAEQALRQAQAAAALAEKRSAAARLALSAVEARATADRATAREKSDAAEAKRLALAAGKAERQAALARTEAALLEAEQARPTGDKKAQAEAEKKLAAARKARDDARAAAAKEDATYTTLVKINPATSTGRRLALARWIASRDNPLTARVAVNHVWMRHFGRPLVPTVANFGLAGKPPSHPELLDWLAVEFMESGWSMKNLHRLLVTSETYRLSSHVGTDDPRQAADAENVFLWRMNTRRMEGEAVRDSLLAAAGRLDPALGGPILNEREGQTSRRRSIYFRFNTEYRMQFLDQFDAASPSECFERRESVIPQQSLALMNSALALAQARHLAAKLAQAEATPAGFVTAAFEVVLGRAPTAAERDRCERFLREQAEVVRNPAKLTPFPGSTDAVPAPSADPVQRARENLIQVLFNHNDFVTIR